MKKLLIIGAAATIVSAGAAFADGGMVIRQLADTYLQSDGTQAIDLNYYCIAQGDVRKENQVCEKLQMP